MYLYEELIHLNPKYKDISYFLLLSLKFLKYLNHNHEKSKYNRKNI